MPNIFKWNVKTQLFPLILILNGYHRTDFPEQVVLGIILLLLSDALSIEMMSLGVSQVTRPRQNLIYGYKGRFGTDKIRNI